MNPPPISSGGSVAATSRRHLAFVALGIVFGDIATSPLYAVKECFSGPYGIAASRPEVLGVLSLMVWALFLIVSLKYLVFILRADSGGEGGVLVLASLAYDGATGSRRDSRGWVFALGLFAACLLYGDGIITPAISVLSAVEGLRETAPRLDPWVLPITVAILIGLFAIQRVGTARVGMLFGPVIALWLAVIALLGVTSIWQAPQILAALNPAHALGFLMRQDARGYLVLGAVFLVVTGGEALYADLGHFGRGPIRFAWFAFTLPALLLNYFGQGAHLLRHPADAGHPFYRLVPDPLIIPMVVLATLATIVASQAVISGAYSLTRQAIQLGYLPKMKIIHTSADQEGQIYMPFINTALAIATIGVVIGFRTSSHLAAAYGVAVSAAMLVSTLLFFVFIRRRWQWSLPLALLLCGLFFIIDFSFFVANATKFLHGGWFPLIIAACVFMIMSIWRTGTNALHRSVHDPNEPLAAYVAKIRREDFQRTHGTAVFLCSAPGIPSHAFINNLTHNRILHEKIVFLHIAGSEVPRVPRGKKIRLNDLGNGFSSVIAEYGFMETPNVMHVMALARHAGGDFPPADISFFLGNDHHAAATHSPYPKWRTRMFCWLERNSQPASAFFSVPAAQTIEIGSRIDI